MAEQVEGKRLDFKGRLSFNKLTIDEAFKDLQNGPFKDPKKTTADVSCSATVLLTQAQYDKVKAQLVAFIESSSKLPKGTKGAIEPKHAAMLLRQIEDDSQRPLNTPFKEISDSTATLFPDAVMAIKLLSSKGQEFDQLAIVRSESELDPPDPDILSFPTSPMAINRTTHKLYSGCWVIASLEFYAYMNGGNPGVSASGSRLIFQKDDAAFSGAAPMDVDSIFALDSED